MRHLLCGLTLLAPIALFTGCGTGLPEQTIQVDAANDPLNEPRSILKRYADGQKIGSERESFDRIVKSVQESDPAAAEILSAGFEELKKTSSDSAFKKKAKELYDKIAPKIGGPAPE